MLGLSVSSKKASKGVDQGRRMSLTVASHLADRFSLLPSFFIGVAKR